ncbi:hypothetical protein Q9L58_002051 [Maublancomyces gigas]|uniref:Uncharacterized protein n=1 Tax=Discina gigas TaxID=1032678 RepID=A0ABR3GSD5_9PEZI
MSTLPSKAAAALISSAAEASRVDRNIQSTKVLNSQLERKYRQDAEALEREIKYQTLKFEVHTAKLNLRKFIFEDDSDSITMLLEIITRTDKRLLEELQQKARYLGWTFKRKQREYVGYIERWGHEMDLWVAHEAKNQ